MDPDLCNSTLCSLCMHAKSLQSCSTLCDPMVCSLGGCGPELRPSPPAPHWGLLQRKGQDPWVAAGFVRGVTVDRFLRASASLSALSRFSHVQLFVTPWTIACKAPLFMEFSRHEYWSGFPCPLPGDLPDPGIKPTSLTSPALVGGFFTSSATWEAQAIVHGIAKESDMTK